MGGRGRAGILFWWALARPPGRAAAHVLCLSQCFFSSAEPGGAGGGGRKWRAGGREQAPARQLLMGCASQGAAPMHASY